MRVLLAAVAMLVLATCARSEGKPPTPAGPVGKVSAVTGTVTAKRAAAAPRPLAVGDAVFADDLVTTGVGASLTLVFTAKGGQWELGAERSRALSDVVAQLASLGGAEARGPDVTAAAGRHAELEAADTAGTTKPPAQDERKEQLAREIQNAGVLKVLDGKPGGGDVLDDKMGGLGLKGTGLGGGGTGEGTIGLGNLGTIGHGAGDKDKGYGRGVGNLKMRAGVAPEIVPGTATVSGSLEPELIRRIVRRHTSEVEFCYQNGLSKDPALAGRVVVAWVIAASGAVQAASVKSSTLGSAEVEKCLVSRVKAWEFPKPQGGIVMVSYPFVLKTKD